MNIRMINKSGSKPILTFAPSNCYIATKRSGMGGGNYIIIRGSNNKFGYSILFDPDGDVSVVSNDYINVHFIPSRCITESIEIDIRY